MIRTENLTKRYKNVVALDGLNLTVGAGEIFGYIGPNGAGKTTTIRILCGLLQPTSGAAEVAGVDVVKNPAAAKAVVGYAPDAYGPYPGMRVWEYLDFFGAAHGLPVTVRRTRLDDVLAITGIAEMKDYLMDGLSRGMLQRVGIARTLVHDPQVLLLDEPTSGLDPRARIEMRELLKKLKGLGKTILVSSHILPELATTCDRIGILELGRLLVCDRMEEVLRKVEQRELLEIEVLANAPAVADLLRQSYPATKIEVRETVGNLLRVAFAGDDAEIAGLLQKVVGAGHAVRAFREVPLDLEKIYLKVTAEAAAGQRRVN